MPLQINTVTCACIWLCIRARFHSAPACVWRVDMPHTESSMYSHMLCVVVVYAIIVHIHGSLEAKRDELYETPYALIPVIISS